MDGRHARRSAGIEVASIPDRQSPSRSLPDHEPGIDIRKHASVMVFCYRRCAVQRPLRSVRRVEYAHGPPPALPGSPIPGAQSRDSQSKDPQHYEKEFTISI